jgi:hypothetical protein
LASPEPAAFAGPLLDGGSFKDVHGISIAVSPSIGSMPICHRTVDKVSSLYSRAM